MKQFIYTFFIVLLLTFIGQQTEARTLQSKAAQVTFINTTGKKCFFQPEGAAGYGDVTLDAKGKCTLTLNIESPAYYQYTDGNQKFHTIYLTPGARIEITENANGVSIQEDNAAINAFINQNRFLGYAAKGVPMYSAEWQNGCKNELDSLCNKLDKGGFAQDFVKMHKQYYLFAYYAQLLNSPAMATFMKINITLPDNYYDFLKTMRFDNPNIIVIPKWFNTMITAFSEMEKQGIIPIDKDQFMQVYASKIEDAKVRSAFLVQLLDLNLQKGYSDHFPAYLESVRGAIIGTKDQTGLKEVEAKYAQLKAANKDVMKGMPAPDFTAVDVDGKTYKMSDFAGKVVVLDFWFTGCIPCKAEMPFMEKIAESMQGEPIQFISMSLDSGKQLLAGWKEMVKDYKGPALNLNMPEGFKSALAQKYGIRSVPRIVIIDKEGKIYDSNAVRPSDPKLKQTLEAMLGKSSNAKEEVQKDMMALMQAATAAQKDEILKSASARFRQTPEVAPMLNMMMFQVIQSYANEKNYEKADAYIARIAPSDFRRDIVFLVGTAYIEGGAPDRAMPYIKEAAEATVNIQKANPADADENKKLPIIFGAYGNLLVSQGKMVEATQWIEQAYANDEHANFELMKSYATIQLFKKQYSKALPILEKIARNGMASEAIKEQLKEAYVGTNGSDKGFDKYADGLLKESADKQKKEIQSQMVSEPAPLFTLKNLKGEDVSLAALKGKVVILDFWATWCGPCKSSFPAMQKAANKYNDNKDVAFLFIDTWESAKNPIPAVKTYIEENNYNFNVLFDLKNPESNKCEVIESYGAKGIPAKYIIDKEGNIRFKLVGFSGSNEQVVSELSEMIDILL